MEQTQGVALGFIVPPLRGEELSVVSCSEKQEIQYLLLRGAEIIKRRDKRLATFALC
jgi:hypothetical protein